MPAKLKPVTRVNHRDLAQRVVCPEILETLDPEDPAAIKGRRDLKWINAVMGNHGWLSKMLRGRAAPGARILELGAGDGVLGQRLVRDKVCRADQLHGIDLVPRPARWPAEARWTTGDVLAESQLPEAEVIVSSLFLHHLHDDGLMELGRRLPGSCQVVVAAEPARRARHFWQARAFHFLARLHPITYHDMMTSIRGGFRRGELARLLRLGCEWSCREWNTWRGASCFLAVRGQP